MYLRHDFALVPGPRRPRCLGDLRADFHARCIWYGMEPGARGMLRMLVTDGSLATILYRMMRWAERWRLAPLAGIVGKLLTFACGAVIGRGARLGPGLVLLHPVGVVINGKVKAGANCVIESCVTVGAEKDAVPRLEEHVFLGSGARALGGVVIGARARIGANAVVIADAPPNSTAVGVPARIVGERKEHA